MTFLEAIRYAKWPGLSGKTILNPVEQRAYGLLHILEGIGFVIFGRYAPSFTFGYIMQKAQDNARRRGGG